MNYLVVQQWPNTKGNHAGMSHMCDLLVQLYPNEYTKIEMDQTLTIPNRHHTITRFLFRLFDQWHCKHKYLKEYIHCCQEMFQRIQNNDKIFLLEYHLIHADQFTLAKFLRKKFPQVQIIALSHLTPTLLRKMGFSKRLIKTWEKPIDIQLTLGSSLSHFFLTCGIPTRKISTGFHYVDYQYYHTFEPRKNCSERLKVISIGNLQRNFELLSMVVEKTPFIDWIICSGIADLSSYFANKKNVSLKGYINEDSLKQLMTEADISINILDDTVGSNVITTSMAMGLAIIVSDVGSIHDYCHTGNAIFCNNSADDFVDAIKKLSRDRLLLKRMQEESLIQSSKFHIETVHHWFQSVSL